MLRKTLRVTRTPTGVELREGNMGDMINRDYKVVKDLGDVDFETARAAAYAYVWERPQNLWTIYGNDELIK